MHEALMQLVGATVGGGRFRLDRALDKGGMGAVFVGTEVATGREVAIKLMHPGLAGEAKAMKRFQREAEVTTRLNHPHVVEVLAAGGGEGEPPFIVMELLEGASLSARMKSGEAFDAARAVRIARQVLAAVSAGHRIGVVHRDLKPANVMLVPGPEGEIAKVVDYGVARLAMTDTMTQLTATGQVLGTPAYMPPEQAMGEPVGPACDTYAVGAILHRLLTGDPPYGRDKYVELLKRMVVGERPRIHERVPRLGRLADIIERALAHEPVARYQSADEMNDALAALDARPKTTILDWTPPADLQALRLPPDESDVVLENEAPARAAPIAARPPPDADAERARKSSGRARLLVAAGLIAALGGAGVTWLAIAIRGDEAVTHEVAVATGTPAVAPVAVTAEPLAAVPDASSAVDANAVAPSRVEGPLRNAALPDPVEVFVSHSRGPSDHRMDSDLQVHINRARNLSRCWPAGEPLPEGGRTSAYAVDVDSNGRIVGVSHQGASLLPALEACVVRTVSALPADPEFPEGRTIIGVTIGESRTVHMPRRRGSNRQYVVVRPGGSASIRCDAGNPRCAQEIRREIFRRIDLTSCWPRGVPLPPDNLGREIELHVGEGGEIVSIRPRGGDIYPEFTRCMVSRIQGLGSFDTPNVEGISRVNVSFYPSSG